MIVHEKKIREEYLRSCLNMNNVIPAVDFMATLLRRNPFICCIKWHRSASTTKFAHEI